MQVNGIETPVSFLSASINMSLRVTFDPDFYKAIVTSRIQSGFSGLGTLLLHKILKSSRKLILALLTTGTALTTLGC